VVRAAPVVVKTNNIGIAVGAGGVATLAGGPVARTTKESLAQVAPPVTHEGAASRSAARF
jgi:hypothetical protein